jgi:uncharacterized protein
MRRGGLLIFVAIAVVGLSWAKWWPYAHHVDVITSTDAYPGSSILESAGPACGAPSLEGGWEFAVAYFKAVGQALAAALLIAAS